MLWTQVWKKTWTVGNWSKKGNNWYRSKIASGHLVVSVYRVAFLVKIFSPSLFSLRIKEM